MHLLFLVCLFPLAGFLILSLLRTRVSENAAAVIGVGTIGLSFLTTIFVGWEFLHQAEVGKAYTQLLWTWMNVDGFAPQLALRLDALSLTMLGVITGVGFFIHLFASWYMRGDDAYGRFFSYMNLFVASMLFLVLGDNLLFLYFGWEGVGLASYLLIGFWYKDAANGAAARKAFVITRVGDTFMAIGLFLIFHELGTLNIQDAMLAAPAKWESGSTMVTIVALLLLGGAVGKSAQLPLQTWLPDAMAGPTPVSALIHAATMVTAGVYLIARTHVLFDLSPFALDMVGYTGAATLLMAGFIALTQTDIKRILAYSTMSQIGYMFLALGAGAYQSGVFHLMTHAFFKALLFLAAGSVILACHHEQNIFKMGGLRKQIPFTFAVFLIGTLCLVALPGTSGFFSKEHILLEAYESGHQGLWLAGVIGAFFTTIYSFRLIFIAFFGESHGHEVHAPHGMDHTLPLAVLAVFSLIGGFIHLPLDSVLPQPQKLVEASHLIEWLPVGLSFIGFGIAWLLFHHNRALAKSIKESAPGKLLFRYFQSAFAFDWLYDLLFKRPFLWFVRVNRNDGIDVVVTAIPEGFRKLHGMASSTQTGQTRWYAATMAVGAVVVVAMVIFL